MKRIASWFRRLGLLRITAIVAALIAIGFSVGYFTRPDTRPLGGPNYSAQHVVSHVPGVNGPAVRYGDSVVIEGTLCIPDDGEVKVVTTLSWQAFVGGREQTGTFVTAGVGIPQIRTPGCEKHTVANGRAFVNPMPEGVISADKRLRVEGLDPRWRVVGYEEPILGDGTLGARKSFTSDLFEAVP